MLHSAYASCHSSSPSSSPSRFSSERYGSLVDPGFAPLAGSGGDKMPNPAMHVNDFHWRNAAFSLGSLNSATLGSCGRILIGRERQRCEPPKCAKRLGKMT